MHQVGNEMSFDDVAARREKICALADGQLRDQAFAEAVTLTQTDSDARDTWHVYHLVGEVLRSGDAGACGRDRAFADRLMMRIEAEAHSRLAVENPNAIKVIATNEESITTASRKNSEKVTAANDSVFRWKLVAGMASFAAVAAVGWNVIGLLQGSEADARIARSMPASGAVLAVAAPATSVAPSMESAVTGNEVEPVMLRDPRLDELLAAHRQLGGASLLDNPSGFLRNATFEAPAR